MELRLPLELFIGFQAPCHACLLVTVWLAIFHLKEISPGISLERMMLKLKLQYFGHLMRRVDSLEKTRMLGGIGMDHTQFDKGPETR